MADYSLVPGISCKATELRVLLCKYPIFLTIRKTAGRWKEVPAKWSLGHFRGSTLSGWAGAPAAESGAQTLRGDDELDAVEGGNVQAD